MIAQIVSGGIVANVIAVHPSVTLRDDGALIEWIDDAGLQAIEAPAGSIFRIQDGAGMGWLLAGGVLVAPVESVPMMTAADLTKYAANARWRREVGGAVWNGWPMSTDDRDQGKILAELAAIDRGERVDPDGWKFADGVFRLVSNEDFVGLALAVRAHVRACFMTEAMVLTGISAGTITTAEQIDAAFA